MRIRTDERRIHILVTARAAFMRDGYEGTSMNAIVTAVGGSKSTLYGYFPSKESLFIAVVEEIGDRLFLPTAKILGEDGPIRTVLTALARALVQARLQPEAVATWRMVVAEARRFPELGRMVWEMGAMRAEAIMSAWMQKQIDAGRLRPIDPIWLAQQFDQLTHVGPLDAVLINAIEDVPEATQIALADFAVDTFLRAHATLDVRDGHAAQTNTAARPRAKRLRPSGSHSMMPT